MTWETGTAEMAGASAAGDAARDRRGVEGGGDGSVTYFDDLPKRDTRNRVIVGCLFAVGSAVVLPLLWRVISEQDLLMPRSVGAGEYVLATIASAVCGFGVGYSIGVLADGLHVLSHMFLKRDDGKKQDKTEPTQ